MRTRAVLGLFFLSGALGLGYQVLWSKLVLQFVGVSSWSYAVVLAAFMGGLAIGSRVIGRVADRVASPLRLFGILELGVGLYAIAYVPLSEAMGALYARMVATSGAESGGMHGLAVKALVAGLLLLPPTALMGGTYPALVRHAARSVDAVGRRASQLYAVNAAGAVTGTLAITFALMPALGVRASLMALALGNATIGGIALLLARRTDAAPAVVVPEAEPPARSGSASVALALVFVAGFLSFTLEVAWTRLFGMSMGSSTQTFAVVLAAFISGIALGSALLARIESRLERPLAAFGWTSIGAALLVLIPLPAMTWMPWAIGRAAHGLPATDAGHRWHAALKLAACLAVMLPPAVLLGVSVPLVVKETSRRLSALGRDTGSVYAWNTAGNVLGALVAGLALLPLLGVQRLVTATCVAYLVTGTVAIVLATPVASRRRVLSRAVPIGAAGLVLAALLPRWDAAWFTLVPFRRNRSVPFAEARATVESRRITYEHDDPAANILIQASRDPKDPAIVLLVNGKPDASSTGDLPTQLLLAHVPLLLAREEPRDVLVIGLASGITSGAVLAHPVEHLDVVDIVASMPEATRRFDAWNGRPLEDPRTRFIADDARSYLATTRREYDVIISEPSNPWTAGTGSLFSVEMYRRAATKLRPGGLYVQWLQTYELGDPLLAAVMRSFGSAFPHAAAFDSQAGDLLLVGSDRPLDPDPARIAARMATPAVAEQLARIRIHRADDFLYLQRFSGATFGWIAAQAEVANTDDNLLLEHDAPRDLFLMVRPELVSRWDERITGAPSLPWSQARLRAGGVTDTQPLLRMIEGRVIGDPRLFEGLLTATARARDIPVGDLVAELGGRVVEGGVVPPGRATILERLGAAAASGDAGALEAIVARERAAIAMESALSPAHAAEWASALAAIAASAPEASGAALQLLRSDVLAASGRSLEALAALELARIASPPASVDDSILRACRIDPELACEAWANRLLRETGDPRLARFIEQATPHDAREGP